MEEKGGLGRGGKEKRGGVERQLVSQRSNVHVAASSERTQGA